MPSAADAGDKTHTHTHATIHTRIKVIPTYTEGAEVMLSFFSSGLGSSTRVAEVARHGVVAAGAVHNTRPAAARMCAPQIKHSLGRVTLAAHRCEVLGDVCAAVAQRAHMIDLKVLR